MTRKYELGAIALGGAIGTVLRVWAGLRFAGSADSWPWAIFAINVSGSFVLATVAGWLAARPGAHRAWRPLLGAGFCGGYTTFSTFEVELVKLTSGGRVDLVIGYAIASVIAGLTAARLGTRLTGRIPPLSDEL